MSARKCCNNCAFYLARYRCSNPMNLEPHGDDVRMMTTDGYKICDRWTNEKPDIHHRNAFEPRLGGKAKVQRNRYWQKGDPEWTRTTSLEVIKAQEEAWRAMSGFWK